LKEYLKNRIYIAGQQGMAGSAIHNLLKKIGYKTIECSRSELDLTCQKSVSKWFKKNTPDIIINAAGKVGGILDNQKNKLDYIYTNTIIGFNLLNASINNNVKQFINLGSACIYPKKTKQPVKENQLLTSSLEESNEGYALAKISVLKYCEYIYYSRNKKYISLMPANLYGAGDNFNLQTSHVIAALVKKFHYAKINNKSYVEVWGSGNPRREFLHTSDLASAVAFCLKNQIKHPYLNVGGGTCFTIKKLAEKIKKITQFKGKIYFNRKFPDGVNKRKLDDNKIRMLGWKPLVRFDIGLAQYYLDFKDSLK